MPKPVIGGGSAEAGVSLLGLHKNLRSEHWPTKLSK